MLNTQDEKYCKVSKIAYIKNRHPLREMRIMRFIPFASDAENKNFVNYFSFPKEILINYIKSETKDKIDYFNFPINSMFVVKDCKNQKHAYCVIDESNNKTAYEKFKEDKVFEIVEQDFILDSLPVAQEIDKNLYNELKMIQTKTQEAEKDRNFENVFELMDFCELI